jgi:hypothetical protein
LKANDTINVNGTATIVLGYLSSQDATAATLNLKGNLTMTGGTINPNPSIFFLEAMNNT